MRPSGIFACAVMIAPSKGSHHQAAQSQKFRFRALEHRFEMALGCFTIAIKLCRLRCQEQGERRMTQEVVSLCGVATRLCGITGGDSDKTRGQRLVALFAAALNHRLFQATRAAPEPPDNRKDNKQGDRQRHDP